MISRSSSKMTIGKLELKKVEKRKTDGSSRVSGSERAHNTLNCRWVYVTLFGSLSNNNTFSEYMFFCWWKF